MTRLKSLALTAFAAAPLALGTPAFAELSGSVEVAGSSTVYPISTFVGEQFQKVNPGVNVNIQKIGSGGGFKEFIAGNTDASNASRTIKAKEIKALNDKGIEFIETLVAYDGLSVVINKQNDWATELTVDQLKKIFSAHSDAKTWKDIDSSWPDLPLKIYIPAETSGTFDYFKEETVGDDGELRGTSVGENDNLTVTGVADDKGAIGFLGYAYYAENKDKVNAVAIKNKAGEFVKPTPESIESGDYNPLSRPLFVYWKVSSLNKPEVAALASFTIDVAPTAAEEVGYVRLPSWVYDAMMKRINDRITGSIYYDKNLEPRKGTLKQLIAE